MATYVILSELAPEAMRDPKDFKKLAETVKSKIKEHCPKVHWKESYALMGRFDVIDVVEADNPADVERAAMIIRSYGHATTETLHATPWSTFLESM